MVMTKSKIAIMLLAVTGGGLCLSRQAPIEPAPPQNPDAKSAEKDVENRDETIPAEDSPFGLVHDFGKVQRGIIAKQTFYIFNTSNAPLHITSLRSS